MAGWACFGEAICGAARSVVRYGPLPYCDASVRQVLRAEAMRGELRSTMKLSHEREV